MPININGRQLAAEAYAIYLTTSWLVRKDTHTLYLLPSHYDFQQGNGVVPAAAFDVLPDGTVNYAESSDSFLSGRGTPTFGIIGLPIIIDGTQLDVGAYAIYLTTSWLVRKDTHTLYLLPGHYEFQQGNGVVPAAAFDVLRDGTVNYAESSDAFLSGRGTPNFGILGLPIIVDGTQLDVGAYAIYLTTSWLVRKDAHTLYLLPGHYEFQQGNGVVPAAAFDVLPDGTVNYAASSDGFMAGRGGASVEFIGHPIVIDVTQVTTARFNIVGIYAGANDVKRDKLKLLPFTYQLGIASGPVTTALFDVTLAGEIRADNLPPYMSVQRGAGPPVLTVTGYPIAIDATDVSTQWVGIAGLTGPLASLKEILQLLPAKYQLRQANGPVEEAVFDVHLDGTVTLKEFPSGTAAFMTLTTPSSIKFSGYPIDVILPYLSEAFFLVSLIRVAAPNQTLRLLPGPYQLGWNSAPVPETMFSVELTGKVQYTEPPAGVIGVMKGAGTSSITFVGYPTGFDFSAISADRFRIVNFTDWLDNVPINSLPLLPGTYQVVQGTGLVPEATFEVKFGGDVKYRPDGLTEVTERGQVRFVGLTILVDATDLAGITVRLADLGVAFDASGVQPQRLAQFPFAMLTLLLGTNPPSEVEFFLRQGPLIELDEPYPFVEVRQVGGTQTLRLTIPAPRQKRPCLRPPSIPQSF